MVDQKRVGECIGRLRKAKGLTQTALADLLCVTHQAVSKWENGCALPDLDVLMEMRRVFGVSIDDILDDRVQSAEPNDAPTACCDESVETGTPTDTISEEKITVFGSQTFERSVTVDRCSIFGQAHFKRDLRSDTVEVMGKGTFDGAVIVDQLNIMGAAQVAKQVQADSVNVPGALMVGGGITCDNLGNSGATTCGGGLVCDSLRNSGVITVGGGVTADSISSPGVMTLGGGVTVDSMDSSGVATIGGGITTDSFASRGDLTLGGGMTADTVTLSGRFHIGGGLSATSVSITLSEQDCAVDAIHAEQLTVNRRDDFSTGILTVRGITADRADLMNVHAGLAKIRAGKIGEGCVIAELECGPEVELLSGAEVKQMRMV